MKPPLKFKGVAAISYEEVRWGLSSGKKLEGVTTAYDKDIDVPLLFKTRKEARLKRKKDEKIIRVVLTYTIEK